MAGWLGQVPGFRTGKWWKKVVAVLGYAVMVQLIAAGIFGGTIHLKVTKLLGSSALLVHDLSAPFVNALGPPYIATQAFLHIVYVLNSRVSTFLLGAESLAIVLLATNAWGIRSQIPVFNSRSNLLKVAGWIVLLFLSLVAVAVTMERRPWGFLRG